MKKLMFLTIVACLLISTFFIQTTTAESSEIPKKNFAACKVKKNNADFFVSSTEKTMKLKKGILLSWTIYDMHQGLIVVKAKIGKKWVRGEILLDDTTCK